MIKTIIGFIDITSRTIYVFIELLKTGYYILYISFVFIYLWGTNEYNNYTH